MTTTKLVARTDDKFFTKSKYGAIWGTIYFQIESEFFPSGGWIDLTIAFATLWFDLLLRIERGELQEDQIRFFDGPFSVRATAGDSKSVQLSFIHKDAVKVSASAKLQELLREAALTSRDLQEACSARHWSNVDTDRLKALIDSYHKHRA